MATAREKMMAAREKLKAQRIKEEEKLKRLKENLRKTEETILKTEKKEEAQRQVIVGKIFSDRMKTDEGLKTWFQETASLLLTSPKERILFGLTAGDTMEPS